MGQTTCILSLSPKDSEYIYAWPIVRDLSYEDWETHFDEDFTDYIVSHICNYLHTGRYYDDEDTMYRAYFDMDYYQKHWTDYLKWVIDRYKEKCARDKKEESDSNVTVNDNQ